MSDPTIRDDIESTFRELKQRFGIEDSEEPEEESALTMTETGELRLTPPAVEDDEVPPAPTPPTPESTEIESEEDLLYPGSRHLRRRLVEEETGAEEEIEDVVWDERPRLYTVKGEEKEFFTISALARALHREPVSMRKWEEKGYLPPARYRAPGAGKKRDRLYTRAQIEGLVKLAKAEGLTDPAKKKRIDQTNFPDKAHRLFEDLSTRGA